MSQTDRGQRHQNRVRTEPTKDVQNIFLGLLCYLLLLLCSLVVVALVWNSFANGVLYRCSDSLLDLWPPFVHPGSDDSYLVTEWLVKALWGSFVVAAFALPALVLWAFRRFTRE